MKSRSGFTLIELSIVLVIIGLITGSILIGRDLIHAAQIRSVVSDIETFSTAANTFEAKYNCLPGDCANATLFFGEGSCGLNGGPGNTNGTTCNGDGDGLIGDADDEDQLFWQHLALAGLISGSYDGGAYSGNGDNCVTGVLPVSKLPTLVYQMLPSYYTWTWGDSANRNRYFLSSETSYPCTSLGMTPDDTFAIDTKLDDGMPGTGIARIYGGPSSGAGNCADSDIQQTAVYNIAGYSGQLVCDVLFIDAPF